MCGHMSWLACPTRCVAPSSVSRRTSAGRQERQQYRSTDGYPRRVTRGGRQNLILHKDEILDTFIYKWLSENRKFVPVTIFENFAGQALFNSGFEKAHV